MNTTQTTTQAAKASPGGGKATAIAVNASRLIVGLTLTVSGYVKAVDPVGTQLKIHEYMAAAGLGDALPAWQELTAAVTLPAIEFTLGVMLLFAIHRKTVTWASTTFITMMTTVTVWIVAADPVSDCGCFGDAIKLSNGQTLAKNILLLALCIVICRRPTAMTRLVSVFNQWIVSNYTVLFIVGTSLWSLYDLPYLDFRPYHTGANITEGMATPEDAEQPQFRTTFIMEKNGERREFTINDYPDSTWTFIDSRTVQTSKGYEPAITDFRIETRSGIDVTDSLLGDNNYAFWLVSPHVETAADANFGDINRLYEYARARGYGFIGLTSSGADAIERWSDITGAEYPFMIMDDTTLKTMIRSNPGVMLVKGGTIIRKWSHNRLPKDTELAESLETSALGTMPGDTTAIRILKVVLYYVLPLAILSAADRWWARRKQRAKHDGNSDDDSGNGNDQQPAHA